MNSISRTHVDQLVDGDDGTAITSLDIDSASGPVSRIARHYTPDKTKKSPYLPNNLLGFLLNLSYEDVTIVTCDPWKRNCGGVPRNSLVLVKVSPQKVSTEERLSCDRVIMVRITESVPTPVAAEWGDVVYCDPTYSDVQRGRFDRYGAIIFSWADQERLAQAAYNAFQRGVTVLVSNGAFPDLHTLYPAAYRLRLRKSKTIGSRAKSGHVHEEYLLVLDPDGQKRTWEKISTVENRRSIKPPEISTIGVQAATPHSARSNAAHINRINRTGHSSDSY